jgi:EmrB/QacA subfamily drug resistance transporter
MESVSASRSNQILTLLAVAQLMGVLDFSIVNVALPSIQRNFHLAPADLQWVVSVYALVFGGFLLLGGRAADLFDRKRVFMLGLGLFSLAGLSGGLAPSLPVILGARAVQGLGGAIVSPTALALLTTTFPEGPGRNWALGVFGSVSGIGFGVGVILGGVLTSVLSWRWVFFVNVPVGLLALLSASLLLPSSRASAKRSPLDLAGAVLFTGAMVSLVLALSQGASPKASMAQVLLPGILAVVFGVIFIVVERRSQHPLVPLGVFRSRSLAVANLMALLTIAIASLLAFILTLYLQSVLGFSPLASGLAFLPAGVGGIAGGQIATRAIRRLGLRGALALGPALIVLGIVLLTRITPTNGAAWVIVGYLIAGVGIVCTVVTTTITATTPLGPELQGLAAGLLTTAQQVGAALGTSLASVVATSIALAVGGDPAVAATTGYRATLYLALLLSVIAAVLAILAIQTRTPVATRISISKEEKHEHLSLQLSREIEREATSLVGNDGAHKQYSSQALPGRPSLADERSESR